MKSKIKLPFGIDKQHKIVHINDVESGKKCNCICPGCRLPLIAIKGNKKQHHFRHDAAQECEHGLESAIHLAAKQIIIEKKNITLPECIARVTGRDSKGEEHTEYETVIKNKKKIVFDTIQQEVILNEMKVDILAVAKNTRLIIEIFYRHKVDDQKIVKIKNANISAIEIDLSNLTPQDVENREAFWSCINYPKRIKWLYNVREESYYFKLMDQVIEQINRQEEKYKEQVIIKKKRENKEKLDLIQALEELKVLRSEEYIMQLKEEGESNPLWKIHSEYLNLKWEQLPEYLNVDVPDGDWIFGCDRRVWQAAFYSYFIERKYSKYYFSIKWVDDWLRDQALCKVADTARVVGRYGGKHPELLPQNILNNLPSSWKTLGAYFEHLCRLGILTYSQSYGDLYGLSKKSEGAWYMVISKRPEVMASKTLEREYGVWRSASFVII